MLGSIDVGASIRPRRLGLLYQHLRSWRVLLQRHAGLLRNAELSSHQSETLQDPLISCAGKCARKQLSD